MIHLIGTDEAGYGPNLGPLVVSATCWSFEVSNDEWPKRPPRSLCLPVSPHQNRASLFDVLDDEVSGGDVLGGDVLGRDVLDNDSSDEVEEWLGQFNDRAMKAVAAIPRVRFGDSKKIYRKNHLASLELPVLVALMAMLANRTDEGKAVVVPDESTWRDWLKYLGDSSPIPFWEHDFCPQIPLDPKSGPLEELASQAQMVLDAWRRVNITLGPCRSRRVFPEEFNRRLNDGLKSDLLAGVTLQLAADTVASLEAVESREPRKTIVLLCDKLGGRNAYRSCLQKYFPDYQVVTLVESRALSFYRLTGRASDLYVRFQVRGEEQIPSALASMIDKYVREVSMQAWNQYWQAKVPNLAPTAGYPVDARRFMAEIAAVRKQEAIADEILWRNK